MISILEDRRVKCTSIMTMISTQEYLSLIDNVYRNRGGIEGQRAKLTTKTATTIRKRLVDDLILGAVIPPIVIGLLVSKGDRKKFSALKNIGELSKLLDNVEEESLSIIDGMQRTTALKEASLMNQKILATKVRVEFWVTDFVNSLIYRMLVLNTGQVPWELARQLETIYGQLLKQISSQVSPNDVSIFLKDDARRRSDAGQYQSRTIIELFLIFSSRKEDTEIKDRVAEDFARLDTIETSSHSSFVDYYISMLSCLVRLDRAFARLEREPDEPARRFASGKDIFSSLPAMAGFAAAMSIYIFDEPGFEIDWNDSPKRLEEAKRALNALCDKLEAMKLPRLKAFVQLDLLEERFSGRRGGVGRHERELFRRAFLAMIRNADRLTNLAPCWRAS